MPTSRLYNEAMAESYRRQPEHARELLLDAFNNSSLDELAGIFEQLTMAFPPEALTLPLHDEDGMEMPSPNSLAELFERIGLEVTIAPARPEPQSEAAATLPVMEAQAA